jgi:hypothetical protein
MIRKAGAVNDVKEYYFVPIQEATIGGFRVEPTRLLLDTTPFSLAAFSNSKDNPLSIVSSYCGARDYCDPPVDRHSTSCGLFALQLL